MRAWRYSGRGIITFWLTFLQILLIWFSKVSGESMLIPSIPLHFETQVHYCQIWLSPLVSWYHNVALFFSYNTRIYNLSSVPNFTHFLAGVTKKRKNLCFETNGHNMQTVGDNNKVISQTLLKNLSINYTFTNWYFALI